MLIMTYDISENVNNNNAYPSNRVHGLVNAIKPRFRCSYVRFKITNISFLYNHRRGEDVDIKLGKSRCGDESKQLYDILSKISLYGSNCWFQPLENSIKSKYSDYCQKI